MPLAIRRDIFESQGTEKNVLVYKARREAGLFCIHEETFRTFWK
jgi:hypothetical protein